MHDARKRLQGSITLVAMSLAIVIGISLASYIALCQQSLQLSTRTMHLSQTRQLAETGLEEALWSLNTAVNPKTGVAATAWTNATWTTTGLDKSCTITGYTLGQGATGQIYLTITNFSGPTITPAVATPIITATATVTVPGQGSFTRTLTGTARPAPVFANALGIIKPSGSVSTGSTYAVIFKSGGLVDSWDSDYVENVPITTPATPHRDYNALTPNTPYPGTSALTTPATTLPSPYASVVAPANQYPTAAFNYAAVVAAPNIILNNAEIRGYAATSGNPINITGGSKVTAPPLPGTPPTPPNIQATRVSKSAFVPTFTVSPPTGAYDTSLTSLSGVSTRLIGRLDGVWEQYQVGADLTIRDSGTVLTVQGPVVIRVDGDLNIWYAAKIEILPGARLEMYVSGSVQIGGGTGSTAQIDNKTKEPKRMALYCTNNGTRNFEYYSDKDFCGVIYSASTNSKIIFKSNPEFQGAILAKYNIEFDPGTNPKIHYDLALQYLPKGWFKGVTTPFMLEQVTESILP